MCVLFVKKILSANLADIQTLMVRYMFYHVYKFQEYLYRTILSKKYVILWEFMKSVNVPIKCFITYINNEAKTPRFSRFITNDLYITVSKHRFSSGRFTINLCEFSPQYVFRFTFFTLRYIYIYWWQPSEHIRHPPRLFEIYNWHLCIYQSHIPVILM